MSDVLTKTRGSIGLALVAALLAQPAGPARAASAVRVEALASIAAPEQTALAVMLATHWVSGQSPAGYLVSEKLDGVRAVWDGQVLRFRSGRWIAAPGWFTAGFPRVPLDGELWMGRQQFDRLSGIVRRAAPVDSEWRQVRFMVFDSPGGAEPFSTRTYQLNQWVKDSSIPWLAAVPQRQLASPAALKEWMDEVTIAGGEGLMLHRAAALWRGGRSDDLRKLKNQPDEDGRVVGILPGKGQFAGLMGALLIQAPDGQLFSLGTGFTQAQRDNSPPVGSMVTYRFRDRTPKGLPRFASFLRLREPE